MKKRHEEPVKRAKLKAKLKSQKMCSKHEKCKDPSHVDDLLLILVSIWHPFGLFKMSVNCPTT